MGEVIELRHPPPPAINVMPETAVFIALRSLAGDDVCAMDVLAFMNRLTEHGYKIVPVDA